MTEKLIIFKLFKSLLITFSLLNVYGCINNHDNDDILSLLIEKPETLEFLEYRQGSGEQLVFKATYRVSGKNAQLIEDLLHEKYGMSKLKFVCCGWEASGGQLEITDKFNDKYQSHFVYNTITISMSVETLISDRDKWDLIPYFYVFVEVFDI